MKDNIRSAIVIGGGIAGLSSAIYLARGDNSPLVIEGPEPGGQLTWTTDVANYPGFPESVGGTELVQKTKEQAQKFGAEFENGVVDTVQEDEEGFIIELGDGRIYRSKAVVAASGARSRTLGVKGEDELMGYGVSTFATCDGAFFRDDDMIVVGGGDSAFEEAAFLTRFADTVYLVHRREGIRAEEYLQNEVEEHVEQGNIEMMLNTEVKEISGSKENGVDNVTLVHNPDGYPMDKLDDSNTEEIKQDVEAVFLAIGHIPNTEFLSNFDIQRDEDGYVNPGGDTETSTRVDGLFVAGDVTDKIYQQAATAAGGGVKAGMDANNYLKEQ